MNDFLDVPKVTPHPVWLIIGLPRHGKTEVGKAMAEVLGCGRGSTSTPVYMALAAEWSANLGIPVLDAFHNLLALPKEQIRPDLVRVGDALCKENPAALSLWLVDNGNYVIDGIRRRSELDYTRKVLAERGHKVTVCWVWREPPPPTISDNTEVTAADASCGIFNNYETVEELHACVRRFLS